MNKSRLISSSSFFSVLVALQGCGNSSDSRHEPNPQNSVPITGGSRSTSVGGTRSVVSTSSATFLTGGNGATGGVTSTVIAGAFSGGGGTRSSSVVTGGIASTGGVPSSTGGNGNTTGGSPSSTGGTRTVMSATGGATGGTTSAVSSGGISSMGGSNAGFGGSDSGIGGLTSACVPSARPAPASVSSAWNCGTPTLDTTFSGTKFMDSADKALALSETNLLVLGNKVNEYGYLMIWDGVEWSTPRILLMGYEHSVFSTIANNGSTIWIGGHAECADCEYVPRVMQIIQRKLMAIQPQELSTGLPSSGEVASLWSNGGKTLALVNSNGSAMLYELVDSGTSKAWALSISFEGVTGKELWGNSPDDLFVIGQKNGEADASSSAFMTRFDGCVWTSLVLPSDLTELSGIHGAGGTLIVIGYTGTKPVRLISSDLQNWARVDGDGSASHEGPVWMTSANAVLVGSDRNDSSETQDAMLTMGTTPWKSFALEAGVSGRVTSIARIPETNTYFITSSAESSPGVYEPRVYRMSCQE